MTETLTLPVVEPPVADTKVLVSWAEEPCPVWCDGDHPDCPEHLSSAWMCFVRLSMEVPVVVMMDGGNGTTVPIVLPKELEVYLEQQVGDNVPRMVIGKRPSGDVLLQCAPTEAMHLGNALLRLAAMAMGGKMMECGECEGHEA